MPNGASWRLGQPIVRFDERPVIVLPWRHDARPGSAAGTAHVSAGILLTAKGLRAVRDTSVLESERLAAVLRHASPADRAAISEGLTKLADACRRYREGEHAEGDS